MTWKDEIRKRFDSSDLEDYVRQIIKEFTAEGNVYLWDMVELYNSNEPELMDTLKDLDIEQIFDEMIEQIEKLEKTMKEVHSLIKQEMD
tara:strand:+ start:2381 stop:2647 length:267 start_codon:yes stop_codon:yes gene_type:complete